MLSQVSFIQKEVPFQLKLFAFVALLRAFCPQVAGSTSTRNVTSLIEMTHNRNIILIYKQLQRINETAYKF